MFGSPVILSNTNLKPTTEDYFFFSSTTFFSLAYMDYYAVGAYKYITLIENLFNIAFFANIVGIVYSDLHDELKQETWIPLKNKAYEELKVNLNTLLANIDLALGITRKYDPQSSQVEISFKEYKKITLEDIAPGKRTQLSNGDYGDLFKTSAEYFADLQRKYQEYFNPEITVSIIDIQKFLRFIDQDIRIFYKDELRDEDEKFKEIFDNLLQITKHIEQIDNRLPQGQKINNDSQLID